MKVKFTIVATASGSVGGLTASRGRGGPYFRIRAIPTNPSSAQQVTMRTIFGNLSTAWLTLTPAQRDAWETYGINVPTTGPQGDELILTGQQMYVRNNAARIQAGLARIDDGPVVFAMDALSPITVVPNTIPGAFLETSFLNTDGWANEVGGALLIYGGRQVSPTTRFFKGPYRLAGSVLGAVIPPTSPDVTIPSPFSLNVGNFVGVRCLSVRADGRISPTQFIGPNVIIAV